MEVQASGNNDGAGTGRDDEGAEGRLDGDSTPLRILLCLDEKATIPDLVAYVRRAAVRGELAVRAVHVVDHAFPSGLALETEEEAKDLVDEAVFELQMAGTGGEGAVRHARMDRVAATLVDEAASFAADRIVLGAPRRRLFGLRVREQVVRRARATSVVAPHQREGD
ncbi:MAG TPA: universal stress protein [Acidimicrobiales bacterium]|nr:universal stress protein [Acidimicrobiales bacterium]